MSETVSIQAADGTAPAYVFRPTGAIGLIVQGGD